MAPADSAQTDGTGITYEAAVAAVPTVKHVQDLIDSIPRVSRLSIPSMMHAFAGMQCPLWRHRDAGNARELSGHVSVAFALGIDPVASQQPSQWIQWTFRNSLMVPVQDLLAQAASDCGAHARALLYFEAHVRAAHGGGYNPAAHKSTVYSDDDVSYLQARWCHAPGCRDQDSSGRVLEVVNGGDCNPVGLRCTLCSNDWVLLP